MGTTTNFTQSWYTMDNKLGVNLLAIQSSINTSVGASGDALSYPQIGYEPKLGDRVQGNNGSEWMFIQASTTCTQYGVIAVDVNFQGNPLTSALAVSNLYTYGIPQFSATQANSGDQFWIAMKANGGGLVRVTDTAVRGAKLYISAGTPGALTSTATNVQMTGIAVNTSMSSTTATVDYVQYGYIVPYVSV